MEFHRHLCKYCDVLESGHINGPAQGWCLLSGSIIQNMERYLKGHGVQFNSHMCVSDVRLASEDDIVFPTQIQCTNDGSETLIPVASDDIVIVELGSVLSGALHGSNKEPPPPISWKAETIMNNYWLLWFRLAKQAPQIFGSPSAFCTHTSESKLEVFTVTLKGPETTDLYECLRKNYQYTSILDTSWSMCVFLPDQPISSGQPDSEWVFWGHFVHKPMCCCAGEEILIELLWHIGQLSDRILASANTTPCLLPLATSALMKRGYADRPDVIPRKTKHIALVGQFSEARKETASTIEQSIRSAQIAVYSLMGLDKHPPDIRRNAVSKKYGRYGC